jgi:hypothetical protein
MTSSVPPNLIVIRPSAQNDNLAQRKFTELNAIEKLPSAWRTAAQSR